MRRIDVEPTEENIIDALANDVIFRNEELKDFLHALDSIEGSFSIFIDGRWGDGKTFFIKEAVTLLRHFNPFFPFEIDNNSITGENGNFFGFELCSPYLPVYYNAWENDHFDEPVLSLIKSIIADHIEAAGIKEIDRGLREKILGVLKSATVTAGITIPGTGIGAGLELDGKELVDAFSSEDILAELYKQETIMNKLRDLLCSLLPERANKIVLFVDELDRCRPPFALKTLETIKFLFKQDEVIIVFATDKKMLAHTIKGYYGSDFDAEKYLQRFYDRLVLLPLGDISNYLISIGVVESENIVDEIVADILKRKPCSLRDLNRYQQVVSELKKESTYAGADKEIIAFIELAIAPVLAIIVVENPDLAGELLSENGLALFWEEVQECEPFLRELKRLWLAVYSPPYYERARRPVYDAYTFCSDIFTHIFVEPHIPGELLSSDLQECLNEVLSSRNDYSNSERLAFSGSNDD